MQYLSPTGSPSGDFTDLWFNPSESGWGLNVVQHASRNIFAVWFTFGPDGKPTWYTILGGTWTSPTTCTAGTLYATTGAAGERRPRSRASSVTVRKAGSATLAFTDDNHGTLAYSVNGVAGSKSISRQPY